MPCRAGPRGHAASSRSRSDGTPRRRSRCCAPPAPASSRPAGPETGNRAGGPRVGDVQADLRVRGLLEQARRCVVRRQVPDDDPRLDAVVAHERARELVEQHPTARDEHGAEALRGQPGRTRARCPRTPRRSRPRAHSARESASSPSPRLPQSSHAFPADRCCREQPHRVRHARRAVGDRGPPVARLRRGPGQRCAGRHAPPGHGASSRDIPACESAMQTNTVGETAGRTR